MRQRVRVSVLAALLLTAMTAPVAVADDEREVEHEAQARFEEGLQRAKVGDFEAARVSFVQAYAVLHRPRILWNLALCEEKTGRTLDALFHFRAVARDSSASESDRTDAQNHATSLHSRIGLIEVRAPPGAVVMVDGNPPVGTTPLAEPLEVMPGRHVIEAKLPRGTLATVVEATAGEVKQATFAAAEAPAAPEPVTVRPPEGAGPAGPGVAAAAPTTTSHGDASTRALPRSEPRVSGSQASGSGAAPGDSKARLTVVAATGGVALSALAVGVYLAFKSQDEASTANGYRAQSMNPGSACYQATSVSCAAWNDAIQGENRDATLATAMYVTAGVLAAAAVVTWFVWPKPSRRQPTAWVLPSLPLGNVEGGVGVVF
jgi:hypothetical protein